MSMAEITEGRLNLTAAQSRCHFNTNCSDSCIPTRTPASMHALVCKYAKVGTSIAPKKKKEKKCSIMSAHTGGKNQKHSLVKMMNWAQCYNEADATWHVLWGLSSCAFLFPLERCAATEISLIPTKHLCHIINTSQSCLSTRNDSGSSVLIFVFYSVFVLCREVVLFFFFFFVFVCFFFRGSLLCSVNKYWGNVHAFFWTLLILGFDSLQQLLFCPFSSLYLFQLTSTKRL